MEHSNNCPCGGKRSYQQCCQRFHSGAESAQTAEQLMRSRYSAFVKANVAYLLHTRHASTRDLDNPQQLQRSCEVTQWTRLDIKQCQQGRANDKVGTVSFSAHYTEGGKPGVLSETSRFVKEGQQWYYLDGEHNEAPNTAAPSKLGRNAPCWCGSGKKFKRCHN